MANQIQININLTEELFNEIRLQNPSVSGLSDDKITELLELFKNEVEDIDLFNIILERINLFGES